MKVVYALEKLPKKCHSTIFLAGPTPRDSTEPSWRKRALELLEALGYTGHVFVPELRKGRKPDHKGQIAWEKRALNRADCILFWVPRNTDTMLGLNTNIEWGMWHDSGKVVLGVPPEAFRTGYLHYDAEQLLVPEATTLEATVELAFNMVGGGAPRKGGECEVPLRIWQTSSFQQWYTALKEAGNRLDHAELKYVRYARRNRYVYLWALQAEVYVRAENRSKSELVIGRPDISSVLLYVPGKTLDTTEVVLVRECRLSVSNRIGFVLELPGGSDFIPSRTPLQVAVQEVLEETGLEIDPGRLTPHGPRQAAATMSAHRVHLFSAQLSADEMKQMKLRQIAGTTFGDESHGGNERTSIRVMTLPEVKNNSDIDWLTLSMIQSVLW